MPERLRARAPAKVNLALDVLGRRPDGYHELDTIFLELDLADDVELLPGAEPGIDVDGPCGAGTPGDRSNLAWRALELAAAAAGEPPAHRIVIHKRIPPAGGLAGGSSDAAAVLRLAAQLWPGIAPHLPQLALQLGSDVPFFLLGGLARGRGRGEKLEFLPLTARCDVLLFPPGAATPSPPRKTAAVFEAYAALPPASPAVPRVLDLLAAGHLTSGGLLGANALEPAALRVFPGLADHRARIEAALAQTVVLTGAGPTWFWAGPPGAGAALAERARSAGLEAILTRAAQAP